MEMDTIFNNEFPLRLKYYIASSENEFNSYYPRGKKK